MVLASVRFFQLFRRLREGLPASLAETNAVINDVNWVIELFSDFKASMNTHRNSLLPVNTLPAELLLRVFEMVAPMGVFHEEFEGQKTQNTLAFSQVCRAWRDLAVSTPALWIALKDLGVPRSRVARTILARSQGMPLIAYASLAQYTGSLIETVFSQRLPVRELTLNVYTTAHMSLLETLPAPPGLEKMTLMNTYGISSEYQDLLGGQAPQLRYLDLINCTVHWSSHLYASLTTLKIEIEHHSATPQIRLPDILATLVQVPMLKRLYLDGVIHSGSLSQELSLPGGPIRLSRLERLEIHDDLPSAVILLQHLVVPHKTRIKLRAEYDHESMEPTRQDVELAIDYLSSRASSTMPIRMLDFEADDRARMVAESTDENLGRFELNVSLQDEDSHYDEHAPTPRHLFHSAIQQLHIGDITTLSIHNEYYDNLQENYATLDVYDALLKLTSLRTLRLSYSAAMPGVLALLRCSRDSPDCLPALTHLTLHRAFISQLTDYGDLGIADAGASLLKCLTMAVAERDNTGRPIRCLSFDKCSYTQDKLGRSLTVEVNKACGSYVPRIVVVGDLQDTRTPETSDEDDE
jgi:hypothetical protein